MLDILLLYPGSESVKSGGNGIASCRMLAALPHPGLMKPVELQSIFFNNSL